MSLPHLRNSLRPVGRIFATTVANRATPVLISKCVFSTETTTSATDVARASISKDDRKRIAAVRLAQPTLQQRIEKTEGLYSASQLKDITEEDVGRYVTLDLNDVHPSLQPYVAAEAKASGNYWLVRPETLQTIKDIEQFRDRYVLPVPTHPADVYPKGTKNLVFLHGLSGTGKSIILAQAAAYFKQKKWIVVSSCGYDVSHDIKGLVQPAVFEGRTGIFEQHLKSREYLQYLAVNFGEQLKQIPLVGEYEHFNWERSDDPSLNAPEESDIQGSVDEFLPFPRHNVLPRPKKGTTLFDLVNVGAWRCDLAGPIFSYMVDELRKQSQIPVLFAFDDVNQLDQDSEMWDLRDPFKRLSTRVLSIGDCFARVITEPPVRGATLIASNAKLNAVRMQEYMERAATHRRIYNYTSDEIQGALEHYSTSKFLLTPLDLEILRRCELLTGGVPKDVYRFCVPH